MRSHRWQSASVQQRCSTSGGPLQWWDRSANAVRLSLSPHGRPSVTMADVGCMAVSTQRVRGCSGSSCPGFLPGNFYLELLDHHPQRGRALRGVARCVAAAGLERSAPLSQPPHVHVLTESSLTLTGRSSVAAFVTCGRGSTTRGRGLAAAAAATATSLSAAGRGASREVRLCRAGAHLACMCMHLTAC